MTSLLDHPGFFLVIVALAWSLIFFGGTMCIVFSWRVPWTVRWRWIAWSMLAPIALVLIALILSIWPDTAAGSLIAIPALLVTPIANWLTFKRFKARHLDAPVAVADAVDLSVSPRLLTSSLTLAWIVFAIGLYLSVKGVGFAVEMFYGGPWADPDYAHFMGAAVVLLGAIVLWSGVRMLRTRFALRAQARRSRLTP